MRFRGPGRPTPGWPDEGTASQREWRVCVPTACDQPVDGLAFLQPYVTYLLLCPLHPRTPAQSLNPKLSDATR